MHYFTLLLQNDKLATCAHTHPSIAVKFQLLDNVRAYFGSDCSCILMGLFHPSSPGISRKHHVRHTLLARGSFE